MSAETNNTNAESKSTLDRNFEKNLTVLVEYWAKHHRFPTLTEAKTDKYLMKIRNLSIRMKRQAKLDFVDGKKEHYKMMISSLPGFNMSDSRGRGNKTVSMNVDVTTSSGKDRIYKYQRLSQLELSDKVLEMGLVKKSQIKIMNLPNNFTEWFDNLKLVVTPTDSRWENVAETTSTFKYWHFPPNWKQSKEFKYTPLFHDKIDCIVQCFIDILMKDAKDDGKTDPHDQPSFNVDMGLLITLGDHCYQNPHRDFFFNRKNDGTPLQSEYDSMCQSDIEEICANNHVPYACHLPMCSEGSWLHIWSQDNLERER